AAEIRAGYCRELLRLAGDLAGAAARPGHAGGRALFHRDLRAVVRDALPKADRGGDARVSGFGRKLERRAQGAAVDLRRAVAIDDYLSVKIWHDRYIGRAAGRGRG